MSLKRECLALISEGMKERKKRGWDWSRKVPARIFMLFTFEMFKGRGLRGGCYNM
jgi:hypothetical protein